MFSERVRLFLQDIVEDADQVVAFVGNLNADELAADTKTLLAVERLYQRIRRPSSRSGRRI